MNEVVTINGIRYEVRKAVTPESADADGHHNIAKMMREHGQARQLYMARPKGRRLYFTVEFVKYGKSVYASPTSFGNWN